LLDNNNDKCYNVFVRENKTKGEVMKMFGKSFKDILMDLKIDDTVALKGEFMSMKGYITSIDVEEEVFEICVTESSENTAIGQSIPIGEMHLSSLFTSMEVKQYKKTRQDILDIINLSLALKNQDLFMHYTNELNEFDKNNKKLKTKF
jgi:hypothetical protein